MARKRSVDRGLFQREGVWWIRWTCPYGHDHRERIGTAKGIARSHYQKRKLAVKVEGYCLTEAQAKAAREKPVLFQDAAKRYLAWAEQERPRSLVFRQCAMAHLLPAFGPLPLRELTSEQVDAYIQTRRDAGAAPATVNRERTVLGHLFELARKKWKVVAENPVKDTEALAEPDGKPRPLTHDEEARLFTVLSPRYRPYVLLALHTGLRLGELRAQAWQDIDLAAGVLTVTRPKSKKLERLHLNPVARAVLTSLERTGPLVFPRIPKNFSDRFVEQARKSGLQDLTFHNLRDTFISRLAADPTVSATKLMKLARHRDLRTTMRYLKFEDADLRAAVDRLAGGEFSTETGTHTGTEKMAVSKLLESIGIKG